MSRGEGRGEHIRQPNLTVKKSYRKFNVFISTVYSAWIKVQKYADRYPHHAF